MGNICPDNSTECLLRVLVEANSGYNWNPLNFAFTAAIGALALVIAIITVFQGLLAAGPGRLKASKAAIGPFSVLTKNRFDGAELALRTTARVPLITWDLLCHKIIRKKEYPVPDTLDSAIFESESTATWLTLLKVVGLADPKFFGLIPRATDYLPADVQAAPAAGEMRCIAILALLADSNPSLIVDGRSIKVSGDLSQLVFREHPNLGLVAVYETYSASAPFDSFEGKQLVLGSVQKVVEGYELDRGLQLASGHLSYHDIRLMPDVGGIWDRSVMEKLIKDLKDRSSCSDKLCHDALARWKALPLWFFKGPQRGVRMMGPVACLIAQVTGVCKAFPWTHHGLSEALSNLKEYSVAWRTLPDPDDTDAVEKQDLFGDALDHWSAHQDFSTNLQKMGWIKQNEARRQSSLLLQSAYRFCRDFASSLPAPLSARKPDETDIEYPKRVGDQVAAPSDLSIDSDMRQTLATALTQLDGLLESTTGNLLSCTILRLVLDVASNATMPGRNQYNTNTKRVPNRAFDSQDSQATTDETETAAPLPQILDHLELHDNSPTDGLRAILVFRGMLLGLTLRAGADTSPLWDPNFKNSIVKVL